MDLNNLILAIFIVILIVMAIFLYRLLKKIRKNKENRMPETDLMAAAAIGTESLRPEKPDINTVEQPLRTVIPIADKAEVIEKETHVLPHEEEKISPAPDHADDTILKLEDTISESEDIQMVVKKGSKKTSQKKKPEKKVKTSPDKVEKRDEKKPKATRKRKTRKEVIPEQETMPQAPENKKPDLL